MHAVILYSIGHSTHSIDEFVRLLELHGIQAIADARSSPYSRYSPQFARAALEQSLKEHDIAYVFLGRELGARRSEPECYHNGKVDYRRVEQSPAFRQGLDRLVQGASKMKVAMLCAEKDPLACHRTILVARCVKSSVGDVHHILADGQIETQAQAEERLLCEYGLQNDDLFTTREERVLDAYQRRANAISYQEPTVHG
jgi:uncharacterized protein (DUF488 family)